MRHAATNIIRWYFVAQHTCTMSITFRSTPEPNYGVAPAYGPAYGPSYDAYGRPIHSNSMHTLGTPLPPRMQAIVMVSIIVLIIVMIIVASKNIEKSPAYAGPNIRTIRTKIR